MRGDQRVLARIGFAERWLDRARRQCTEGNVARGVLTLVLADAEVHHALEAAGLPRRADPPRVTSAAILLLGTVISVVLLAARWPAQSRATSSPAPLLVRLSSSSGRLLETMGTQPAVRGSGRVSADSSSPAAPAPFTAAPSVLPITNRAGPPAVSLVSARISMSELIDLVLTAERAVRKQPVSSPSP